ncbi:dynein axonemal heavy chain 6-like isoform X2 [Mytilus californianus]|uniref:dynein axonemal heavy chain 6-like isoform X2 n=1 Tax=Mytilus californianus TaxID=6549 RepID=UPI00224869EA|nr:dynein axonemal heavy chain 6-like isoform X2 [Mytilus californianus]
MADVRGESRTSYLSQSQYSESTVINQDLGDPDIFQTDRDGTPKTPTQQTKVVTFAPGHSLAKAKTIEELTLESSSQKRNGKAADLMARLVDKPENSQVLRMVRGLPIKPKASQGLSQSPGIPRPPSGKTDQMQSSFRTTMFKRDYEKRQHQIKAKTQQGDDKTVLTVGMLHKPQPKPIPATPMTMDDGDDDKELEEIEVLAELAEIMGPGTEPSTNGAKSISPHSSQHLESGMDEISKPSSTDLPVSAERSPTKSPYSVAKDEDDDEILNKDFPDEIPIIDTRPLKGRPLSSNSSSARSDRKDSAKKKESNVILNYLKKNRYDDTVPENDDVLYNVEKLRSQLGWNTALPRHGPDCRKAMETISDIPKLNPQSQKTIKEDDGEFLYCLPKNRKNKRARYMPYDLQIVSANEARSQPIYWTISASYITRCTQGPNGQELSTNTPVLWWLWERRLFYMIHELPVFVQFRKWKTFKQWKRNVRMQKKSGSKNTMYKQLFVANEVLQGCLIHVRSLLEAASGSRDGIGEKDSAIILIVVDRSATLTLDEFKDIQVVQAEKALGQLNTLRNKIIDIVWESCATVAEMEGITHGIRPEGTKKVHIQAPPKEEVKKLDSKAKLQKKFGIKTLEEKKKEEKSSKPLYAQIAEWRKILARLAAFLRSIDYLILEMLRRLVVTAMRLLLEHLSTSYYVTDEDEEKYRKSVKRLNQYDSDEASTYVPSEDGSSSDDDDIPVKKKKDSDMGTQSGRSSVYMASRPESRASGFGKPGQVQKKEGYVIPQFDFDQPELFDGPPDINEVLEEIKQKDVVEEIAAAVFNVQLVLNTPKERTALSGASKHSASSTSSRRKTLERTELGSGKKMVKFTDEHYSATDTENSESESDYYTDEETDGEREDQQESKEGEEDEDDEGKKGDKQLTYAYTEKRKPTLPSKSVVDISPNQEQFKQGIDEIVAGFRNTIVQVVSMLREPRLKVFYSAPIQDLKLNFDVEEEEERREYERPWPDLQFIFSDDYEYNNLLEELHKYIEMEMNLVKQYAKEFDQYCLMVDDSRKLNVEESMAYKPWSTDQFSGVLAKHTSEIGKMKAMTIRKRVHMIQVLSKNYRETCLPYPTNIVDTVHIKLPLIANKRNEDLLTIIKGAARKLDNYPKSVEQFVEHLTFLSKISSELPALENEFLLVNKLFTIAKDYLVNILPEEMALYQTLAPSFQGLKNTILYNEAKKDENIRKFSRDLDTLIQQIRSELNKKKEEVKNPDLLSIDTDPGRAINTIEVAQEDVQSLSKRIHSYVTYQERFGSSLANSKKNMFGEEYLLMDRSDDSSAKEIQAALPEVERDLTLRKALWTSTMEWNKLEKQWINTLFDALQVESLQKNVSKFTQTVYMLEKGLPHNEVVPHLKEKVMEFKQSMPIITSLRNPSLKQRHWDEIERMIGKSIVKDKTFTLGNLIEMKIIKLKDKIQDISTTASNEETLEKMLDKIIQLWQKTDFRTVPQPSRDTYIIGGADDIMAQLEESAVTIGTIRGSRYVSPIKGQVEEWERKLLVFGRTLDEWLSCQRTWLYIEKIFRAPDIQRQLKGEFKMFMQVDRAWKDLMRRVEDRPNAIKSALTPGTLETLQQNNLTLNIIQKNLEDHLETKRFAFPRFYFLSNDELLEILANSDNPNAVQPHLGKCFGNVKSLEITGGIVRKMISDEGEEIEMPKNRIRTGNTPQWLVSFETVMFETVKKHLKKGISDWDNSDLSRWVLEHPGQVVLTVVQIMLNKDVVKCFEQPNPITAITEVQSNLIKSLEQLAGVVSQNIKGYQRMSIEALLTINVHNRDILHTMIVDKVTSKEDFDWKKQLRYEWDEQSNHCQVLQSNAQFKYGYEYLGCSPRLVITQLTDRCYLTLTGAMHLHLGGSPAGPAGTGKTETVKDLAKAMGKLCVVFNCSEGLDFKTLGKFFSGLAQSGSWCCFDEFNRIDIEVLSVVAQQIHTIKAAKDAQAPRFIFEGKDIKLDMSCGYFITMNPTYAGRVELPDNLKTLFRQVAMMVPDYAQIAEIMLFSEGFRSAKPLSRKIVQLYNLASKQLSQQDHYDFGMRAIKSVLVMAGHGRRHAQHKEDHMDKVMTENEESYILMHSLQDANIPKFLAEDVPLFKSILDDLFPGITPPDRDYGVLERAINMAIRDHGFQSWSNQVDKVKQFYNQIMVRHGIMLVGPTGGGKTTIRSILQKALILLPTITPADQESNKKQGHYVHNRSKKGHVEVFQVNPKCVTLGELYGEVDSNTLEWHDGLIGSATRKFSSDPSQLKTEDGTSTRPVSRLTALSTPNPPKEAETESDMEEEKKEQNLHIEWKWLVLDGPVDTLWVENLNTVLDDSKVLCLANGQRIHLASGMRLIFEVDNLSQASPATISRCAMVYMDPVDLGWQPYVKTWLQKLPKDIPESAKKHLMALFDYTIEKGLKFKQKHIRFQPIEAPTLSTIMTLCNILTAYFDFMLQHGGFGNPDREEEKVESDLRTESRGSSRSSSRSKLRGSRKRTQKPPSVPSITKESSQTTSKTGSVYSSGYSSEPDPDSDRILYLMKNPSQFLNVLGKLFVFAYTWSIGGNFHRQEDVDEDDNVNRRGQDKVEKDINICNEFDNFMRELFEVEPPLGVRLPTGNRSIYGYFIDMESGNFVPWDTLVPTTRWLIERGAIITIGETMGVSSGQKKKREEQEITPTVDIVRFSFLSGLLLLNRRAVLLTGDSGVGKSALINYMLGKLSQDGGTTTKSNTILGSVLNYSSKHSSLLDNIASLTKFGEEEEGKDLDVLMGSSKPKASTGILYSMIQCSAQTTSARLQDNIMLKLMKKGKDTLGAPRGRKKFVFVDDLNMPAPEEYGAQPPLELLRQFLESGGFYDTKSLSWKTIFDVTVVAACGPPGGGRNPISPRLLKNFCIFAMPLPSTRSLQHIYQVQLGRFFQEGEFASEVKEQLLPLVSASIAVYYRMGNNMLPTPAKSHYTFNLRDLSKVIQGLLQAHESVIVSKDNIAGLFAHEVTRVFHDRLICPEDRVMFYQFLSDNLHDYFKVKWTPEQLMSEQILFGDFFDVGDKASARVYRPISDRKKLRQVLEEYYMRMSFGNTKFFYIAEEMASQMVFFKDAVEHVTRAARVFRQPGGHMILVGLDGTGKSTVVQLASHIAGSELFKLSLHRGYGITEFRDDLKQVFKLSGVKGLTIVFLLTDADIVKESFLEDINCILNSGEVPDLFDAEELDAIRMELRQAASQADIPDTKDSVYQFFTSRVTRNLHIVLTLSPAGGKFRQRCRMNPAFVNCCTIDWYDEWEEEAMLSVAEVFFENAEFIADESYDLKILKERVGRVCVDIHNTIGKAALKYWDEMRRHYYATPSSYMEFIRLYSKMLRENKQSFINNKERLENGLSKLSEANDLVGTYQERLKTLGPQIEEKQRDTEVLLEQLQKDQDAVEQVQEIVRQEEEIMKRETEIVHEYAEECERDLATVLPALDKAEEALKSLDKSDVRVVRTYANPPELVKSVLRAVCVLFQKKDDWANAKQMVKEPDFLKNLLTLDKDQLPGRVFHKLKRYSKHQDFNPVTVGQNSGPCESICLWVLALEHYYEVNKMVKPKQKRVEEAKEALKLAEGSLAQKQASLQKIQQHLNMLQDRYTESVNQRESLKQEKITTGLRLQRAAVLIDALANEKVRWQESVKTLELKLQGLVGDTLVAAASVAYIGPYTAKYRKDLLVSWVDMSKSAQIPITDKFDLVKSTVDAHQVLKWQNEGLPHDSHSTENALIVKKAQKFPLFIDPQGQAFNYIKEMEGAGLKIVAASDPNYMRTLESAIRVGEAMLLKEVTESLDPALRPVLLRETFTRGGHTVIKLGDTEIEFNDNFRLYMTTSMSNPHYLPAVYIQVNIINFTVTFEGLQEQLLSAVVRQEKPQLENQRSELLESIAADLQFLRDLEDKSLSLLQKTEGHILDDQDLVDTLQKSKGMAEAMYKRIQKSEDTEKKLSVARQKYLPVATRGATLYFVLADLSGIDVMYQFSLEWFQQDMFISCITNQNLVAMKEMERKSSISPHLTGVIRPDSRQSVTRVSMDNKASIELFGKLKESLPSVNTDDPAELKKHMLDMINRLTSSIYRVVSVALFARHQLTFSFMLCSSIMRANAKYTDIAEVGKIEDVEWQVFLQGNIMAKMMDEKTLEEHDGLTAMERLEAQNGDKSKQKSPPKWISEAMWQQCQHLEATLPEMDKLCRSIMSNSTQWNTFYKLENTYKLMTEPFTNPKGEVTEHGIVFPWEQLNGFHRLLIIKVLRPGQLVESAQKFVEDQMSSSYLSTGSFDLKEIYDESSSKTPLIFILSPGTDPASQLIRFAKEERGSTVHLDMISLGRGQGPKAEELINKAKILKGRWVFLQNCHLASSWMPRLQAIVEKFNASTEEVDKQFRLWLSSNPDPCFPISILQTGMKMTVEPPQGLKANMLRAFGGSGTGVVTEKMYEDAVPGPAWPKLLFGLCLFNSVIHERRKYGRLGWNIVYGFNDSDLEVSMLQLSNLLTEHPNVPWKALAYLTGEVTYGGRVTDEWDRRCLHALLGRFFCPSALSDDYSYSPDGIYRPLKTNCAFPQIVTYLDTLPSYDSPEVFGMTENAERACRILQADDMIETIVSVQPRLSLDIMGSDKSNDQIVLEISENIMKELPESIEAFICDEDANPMIHQNVPRPTLKNILFKEVPEMKDKDKAKIVQDCIESVVGNSALLTVLRQEVDRFNNLLSLIHVSLKELLKAVKGEIIMSDALEEAYSAFLAQRVPQRWKNAAYESCKPLGSWIYDLKLRVDFFAMWAELIITNTEKLIKQAVSTKGATEVEGEDLMRNLPRAFWLSGFFFPQGFLTGVLQNHARKVGISVDSLVFNFEVLTSKTDTEDSLGDLKQKLSIREVAFTGKPHTDDGIIIFGLYLDGARWDPKTECLQDSLPGFRFAHLPEILFQPVQTTTAIESDDEKEEEDEENSHVYECPLYRTSARAGTLSSTGHSTNFVTAVSLPSEQQSRFWVMRGVALLCQLDE